MLPAKLCTLAGFCRRLIEDYFAMTSSKNKDVWAKARKKYRLSAMQITMAQAIGLNPKKFGSLANHQQEPWKAP